MGGGGCTAGAGATGDLIRGGRFDSILLTLGFQDSWQTVLAPPPSLAATSILLQRDLWSIEGVVGEKIGGRLVGWSVGQLATCGGGGVLYSTNHDQEWGTSATVLL